MTENLEHRDVSLDVAAPHTLLSTIVVITVIAVGSRSFRTA